MPFVNFALAQTGDNWRTWTYEPYEGIALETGLFLSAFVDFMVMALIFFIVYKKFIQPLAISTKNEKPQIKVVDTIECQYCLSDVHYESSVCKYCTTDLDNPFARINQ